MVFEDTSWGKLSLSEANLLIRLHNEATDDWVYGERLHFHLQQLFSMNKIQVQMIDQLYLLSVDWPFDLMVDRIAEKE